MREEFWTDERGRRVAVAQMTEAQARQALRSLLRTFRLRKQAAAARVPIPPPPVTPTARKGPVEILPALLRPFDPSKARKK